MATAPPERIAVPVPASTMASVPRAQQWRYALRYADDGVVEVGVDEAGRGCLFGRLYTGAVVLPDDTGDLFDHGAALGRMRDSKALTKRSREIMYDYVREIAIDWAAAFAEPAEIDAVNILQADLNAMHRALNALVVPVGRVLVDGDTWRPWRPLSAAPGSPPVPAVVLPEGDATYLAIAAASVVAKVEHDRWMTETLAAHPEWADFGFATGQGYATAQHRRVLAERGPTPLHRFSFAPVRAAADAMKAAAVRVNTGAAGAAGAGADADADAAPRMVDASGQELEGVVDPALPAGIVRTWVRGATGNKRQMQKQMQLQAPPSGWRGIVEDN